jgi:CDGSH-type Zn-finger protein
MRCSTYKNALVAVVARCPSGALHTERKDGGVPEGIPAENLIIVHENSYYQFIGDLEIRSSNVDIAQETRAALCRCGMSANKPFCDNSHREGFMAPSSMVRVESEKAVQQGGKLCVTAHENGSIEVKGNFELRDEAGNTIYRGTSTWLCRCGHSNSKPFCDSTHKLIGFRAP